MRYDELPSTEQVIYEGIADTLEDAENVVKVLESEGLIEKIEARGMSLIEFLFQYCTVWYLPNETKLLLNYANRELDEDDEERIDSLEGLDLIKLEEDKFLLVDESFNH